jgi:hypothetical protein
MPGGKKSAEAREKAALALACGETVAEAAAGSGCSERTLFNWLSDDLDFRQLVQDLRRELLERTLSVLVEAQVRAAWRLRQLVGSADERIALKACAVALGHRDALSQEVRRLRGEISAERVEVCTDVVAEAKAGAQAILDALRPPPPNGHA